jgi:pantoate--beta-alanine ligase
LVVQRLVADFNLPTEIRVCPIVRDADGLALSSRNAYLTADERHRALVLSRSLRLAESLVSAGEHSAEALRREMLAAITAVGGVDVDYIAIVRDGTVDPVETITGPVTVAIAARVGRTRLIDNCRIG